MKKLERFILYVSIMLAAACTPEEVPTTKQAEDSEFYSETGEEGEDNDHREG